MPYHIKQYGYLPGYSGNSRYSFTRQFDQSVCVSFDTVQTDPACDFRVLVQCEPPKLYIAFKDMVYQNYQQFDLVLTYDERLLALPNAKEFIPVGTWINDIVIEKTDQISFLMSSKIWTQEHRMRFQILRELEGRDRIGDFEFLMHRSPPSLPDKDIFFTNAKFHIACENQVMNNMFTEKILDCFKTYTIPIYYGCVNIEKYFDVRGILRFNTIDQFRYIMGNITPDTYMDMLPYATVNHDLAREYWEDSIYQRIETVIQNHIG